MHADGSVPAPNSPGRLVSVIVPTYHRPEGLRRAVQSVLSQDLPAGIELEVVVGLSDPAYEPDATTAEDLVRDPRVKAAAAARPGPAAARNAAIAASSGEVILMIDDDCEAAAGWVLAALAALDDADLVQGRTEPAGPVPRFSHSLSVYPPSWLWESCNIGVRRSAIDRFGRFDESWNPTGRAGGHMGEDVEWGWRLVREGARAAFAPDAVVRHEVRPRSFREYLSYQAQLRYFPQLFHVAPEARRIFYRGYFVNPRHAVLSAAVVAGAGAAAAHAAERDDVALALAAVAGILYLSPLRRPLRRGRVADAVRELAWRLPAEATELAAAVYGSVRWRRLLI